MTEATMDLRSVEIDDSALPPPTAEIEQERRVAIFDLLEDNSFQLPGRDGVDAPPPPYDLVLAIREKRLVFDLKSDSGRWPDSTFRWDRFGKP